MFKDEVSENTLKKRREYYLKHGVKNVFPSGLLESSSLDITTPYMLRNDGELIKCGDYHPYIKSYRKESLEETIKYLKNHNSFLKWFYENTLNEEVKNIISNLKFTQEEIDRLWYLTNQEFCRVRTSNYRYKTGGDNGEIYFRISSENFNWFDLIWNICVKYSPSIDYITIMKDPQVFGKQFDYIKIEGELMNKYPLKNFIELEGEPLAESLLLEDLPKELARKVYGKEYIDIMSLVTNKSLKKPVDIYDILKNNTTIDIHKASFRKVEREDFLKLVQTASVPEGSIICGQYKGISIIATSSIYEWIAVISIDSSKIKKWNKNSIEEYYKSLNIDKKELGDDIYAPLYYGDYRLGAFLDKLDNVSIFICSSPTYERNFKPKTTSKEDSLQKEFNSILLDNNIDLNKIHESINDVFNIDHLSVIASKYVPYTLKNRYIEWRQYRIENAEYKIIAGNKYALDQLNDSRKALSKARKEFKLEPSTKNKRKLLNLKKEVKIANYKYLDFTSKGKKYSYFDRMGCYFILKAFIDEIKELNASLDTQWEKNNKNNSTLSNLVAYINFLDWLQKRKENEFKSNDFKSSLNSIPEWKDINKKIDDVLNDSLKQAQELSDKIKNDDITDTEYNILEFTVNLVENLKYKLETVSKLTQSMKEDLNEDLNMNEDIEKHEELNPLLFENDELKPEIKEAIEKIVNQFVEDLKTDGVKIEVKDIILVGSNVSYNYTKDSDLDIHIIVDKDTLDCDPELYALLYGAYRSLFNKNYDITIKGIPVEIYVELV